MPMNVSLDSDKYIIEELSKTVGEIIYNAWVGGWTDALIDEKKFLEDVLKEYPPTTIAIIKRKATEYAREKYAFYKSVEHEVKVQRTVLWVGIVVVAAVLVWLYLFTAY